MIADAVTAALITANEAKMTTTIFKIVDNLKLQNSLQERNLNLVEEAVLVKNTSKISHLINATKSVFTWREPMAPLPTSTLPRELLSEPLLRKHIPISELPMIQLLSLASSKALRN